MGKEYSMRHTLSVTEVARHFAEYINRVAHRGERFVLVRGKKPIAELCPLPAGKRLAELPDLLASLPHLPETDAMQLAEDIAEARSHLSQVNVGTPWLS